VSGEDLPPFPFPGGFPLPPEQLTPMEIASDEPLKAAERFFQALAVEAGAGPAALAAGDAACPSVRAGQGNGIAAEFLGSLDGTRFIADPDDPLTEGGALLILGADAGG